MQCKSDLLKIFFHRIIGWKRPLRSSSPTIHPKTPCLPNHILKCHIYTFFKRLQGWWLGHLPGRPVPISDHFYSKFLLVSDLNLPWCNLRPLPLVPLLVTWEKRQTPTCLQPSFRQLYRAVRSPPQPPLLQTKQPQLPQSLLMRRVLQTLH